MSQAQISLETGPTECAHDSQNSMSVSSYVGQSNTAVCLNLQSADHCQTVQILVGHKGVLPQIFDIAQLATFFIHFARLLIFDWTNSEKSDTDFGCHSVLQTVKRVAFHSLRSLDI